MPSDALSRARDWRAQDPDPDCRTELGSLISSAEHGDPRALAELEDRFSGILQFGTAGLRGELGAGPMRMNRAVVIRAASGLAGHLTAHGQAGGLVVIGYDARHKSYDFALDTAAVLVGAGLRAALLPRATPTPLLAFAIRHLAASAGVMVTASHNPPRDNGYKVYLGDGAQIAPPADADIARRIEAIGPLSDVPRAACGWRLLGEDIVEAYLARSTAVLTEDGPRDVSVVYTPLHGVGRDLLLAAFARHGFAEPAVVTAQALPDPDFRTVAFPNPEEPGAMDLAFKTARQRQPDIVIANDPDADRCAVAIPQATGATDWRMLTGDEVGALLAAHLARQRPTGTFATSIVSSSLLQRIAAAHGLNYAETLTGFKWIARVPELRYGYEEALGYCVDPDGVRDKDGITAALVLAELTAALKREGQTLAGLLDQLALRHGLHATDQLSVRFTDLTRIHDVLARLREQPPTSLAGLTITRTEDLRQPSGQLPPTEGVRFRLAGDRRVSAGRVVIRPSGTEPKLKCYLEVVAPVADLAQLPRVRATSASILNTLATDLAAAAGL